MKTSNETVKKAKYCNTHTLVKEVSQNSNNIKKTKIKVDFKELSLYRFSTYFKHELSSAHSSKRFEMLLL